jgi:GntR family transcriptional repressor for pyruvate dehydrogenase complex
MASTAADELNAETGDTGAGSGAFRAEPPARQRVADHVFESLARAILAGELKPGEPLPTQRDLAKQFNVSALIVRQAIHRLEDLGLVRVRQGSTTIVLDPAASKDIRLIQMQLELAEPGHGLATAALELQALFLVPLLALAERRITAEELAVLQYLVDNLSEKPTGEQARRFRIEYFRVIAKATRNPLYLTQVSWWSTMITDLERQGRNMHAPARRLNLEFFRKLNAALAAGRGAPQLHLELTRPLLDWADAQRGITRAPRNP